MEDSKHEMSARKTAAERFFRGVYGGNPSVVNEMAAADIIATYPIFQKIFGRSTIRGIEAYRRHAVDFNSHWTDARIEIHRAIAEDKSVVLIWSYGARRADSSDGISGSQSGDCFWGGITLFQFDKTGRVVAEVGEESEPGPFCRLSESNCSL